MLRKSTIFLLSLTFVAGLALQAEAFSVTKIGADPNYSVDQVSGHNVKESYGAKLLSGRIIIDEDENKLPLFFNKDVNFGPNDVKNNFEVTFEITNKSPFVWTDYHLDFIGNTDKVFFTSVQSAEFKKATFTGNEADFSIGPQGSKTIAPNDVLHLNVSFDTSLLPVGGGSIILTQVATAVPVPGSLSLLASGILALAGLGWRRKQI